MLVKPSAYRPGNTTPVLLFFVGLTIAAIIAQTWMVITQDRELTLESEQANGLVAVRILEEHASQTLRDADRKLDAVSKTLHATGLDLAQDEAAIRAVISAEGMQDIRYLKALQYVNLQGRSWISSPDYPSHHADVSERLHIRYLLAHPEYREVLIGHPFQSNYDSQLVLPVARNLFAADGRHLGIISIDIRLSYFATVYARIAKDSNATVALFAEDGFVIVRSPFEARYVDRNIAAYPALSRLRTGPAEGSFEDESFLDDEIARLYTYRKIEGFPIATAYGRDFDSILSAWRTRTEDRILFSGAIIAFVLVLTYFLVLHIRRLHRSEISLRNSEYKFVSIFQRSPVPLAVVRLANDQLVEVNDFWSVQFGFTREEVIGHTALELNFWADASERQPLLDKLVSEPYIDRLEVRFRHKDGRIFTCLLSGRMFDSLGEQMFIFSLVDVTRQREIENEIRELNLQLEQRVKVRTLKLEQTNHELADALASLKTMQDELVRSEKMAALGSLVAGVAHELNTPIGTSVTVASTLQEQTECMLADARSGTLRRSLFDQYLTSAAQGTEILLRGLRRAAELVSSFKQVAVDQSSDQGRCFDLQLVLQEVVVTLAPLYKKTQYTLQLELAPGIQLDSYPGALGQIITNFITNALTHGFEGRERGTMRLATRRFDGEHAEIIFSDDGIGISPENLKRVFDPFFTTKLGHGGSGLGMNIVYNLVTGVLGGRIQLDSAPGCGTTLTVILPLRAPGVGQAHAA